MKNESVKLMLAIMIGIAFGSGLTMIMNSGGEKEVVQEQIIEEVSDNKVELNISNECWDSSRSLVVYKGQNETIEEVRHIEKEKPISTNDYNCELLQFPQLSDEDIYYLEKVATCEARGTDVHTMSLVILVVLNRVKSDKFPNSVYEVITQEGQFSVCRPGGSWHCLEPNEESEEAFNKVWSTLYDYSDGALYFESCSDEDNWHSRTLEFLYESEGMRFYK